MFQSSVFAAFNSRVLLAFFLALGLSAQSLADEIPLGGAELKEWLEAGHYKKWKSETKIHQSKGPHFGRVRAYLNPALFESMTAQNKEHPVDSVAVKELFGRSGETVRGWAVEIKTTTDKTGAENWFWYEFYDNSTVLEGQGAALCSGCHTTGRDYVLTPWPLK